MATYPMPACGLSQGTGRELIDGLQLQRSTSGALRGRSLWTTPRHRYTLVHATCTLTETDALESSYTSNRAANSMTFTWKESGSTITARWVSFQRAPIGKFKSRVTAVLETL